VQPWASCLHTCLCTKQYNLVPANGRWCSAVSEVTADLAKSKGSLYGFGNVRADCRGPGSVPELYARFDYRTSVIHLVIHSMNSPSSSLFSFVLTVCLYHNSTRRRAVARPNRDKRQKLKVYNDV